MSQSQNEILKKIQLSDVILSPKQFLSFMNGSIQSTELESSPLIQ